MNLRAILNVIGVLLILLSALLLVPLGVSLYYPSPAVEGFLETRQAFSVTFGAALLTGLALWKLFPSGIEKLRDREGFAIVALSWIAVSLFGALPYLLTGVCTNFIDAFFETMSGFTTTGATILTDIDSVPRGLLFWRNMTQWLGGMGIIMLSMAIFPVLGIGSFHLFRTEVPGGATMERMQPRLAETAKILWRTYLLLTLIEFLLLWGAGLDVFDALCHTFSTVATGGFSPHNASIAHFDSIYVEVIVILFMFLGSINFALHYQLQQRNVGEVLKNPEFRVYCGMILAGILIATWGLMQAFPQDPPETSLRQAAFTMVSINTTTGYVTDDFDRWPNALRVLILGIMMVGGCAGSTSGSLKVIRFIILVKVIAREIRKLVHPRAIFHVKVGGKPISPDDLTNVVALTFSFMGLAAISCILLTSLGLDLTTAVSGSIATMFNIGPGLGGVGARGNYAAMPGLGKVVMTACMLLGRLEIFGVLLLFLPLAWRK
ncbi:MAG: TrkH family potassium uptake protein [Nitrospinaceae bacterium]|nr:TrkH family potassium uptake protein [Nitrospinaceae bacterium]NIR56268.1 TrkH family potassium uptake protein [Nitrospinaceae bacterium]NIS86724.1 TrkH family potassium uptake protein [Nitrospinaceae bacterium]NIT83557.1 TrkH family potassium uptake protein [Nitrospinaceae bacterium]NIU45762.1 TrkH family potassium uptake protein [Nitrospinaceae bacterium]